MISHAWIETMLNIVLWIVPLFYLSYLFDIHRIRRRKINVPANRFQWYALFLDTARCDQSLARSNCVKTSPRIPKEILQSLKIIRNKELKSLFLYFERTPHIYRKSLKAVAQWISHRKNRLQQPEPRMKSLIVLSSNILFTNFYSSSFLIYARAANHLPTLNCEMVLAIAIVPPPPFVTCKQISAFLRVEIGSLAKTWLSPIFPRQRSNKI